MTRVAKPRKREEVCFLPIGLYSVLLFRGLCTRFSDDKHENTIMGALTDAASNAKRLPGESGQPFLRLTTSLLLRAGWGAACRLVVVVVNGRGRGLATLRVNVRLIYRRGALHVGFEVRA